MNWIPTTYYMFLCRKGHFIPPPHWWIKIYRIAHKTKKIIRRAPWGLSGPKRLLSRYTRPQNIIQTFPPTLTAAQQNGASKTDQRFHIYKTPSQHTSITNSTPTLIILLFLNSIQKFQSYIHSSTYQVFNLSKKREYIDLCIVKYSFP